MCSQMACHSESGFLNLFIVSIISMIVLIVGEPEETVNESKACFFVILYFPKNSNGSTLARLLKYLVGVKAVIKAIGVQKSLLVKS